MKLVDILDKNPENEIVVNLAGDLLPIENIRIQDGKLIFIISASALEDRPWSSAGTGYSRSAGYDGP